MRLRPSSAIAMSFSALVAWLLSTSAVLAANHIFLDEFNAGVNSINYTILTQSEPYTVNTTGPTLRISKFEGTTGSLNEFRSGGIISRYTVDGDFTVTVDFKINDLPLPPSSGGLNESLLKLNMAGSGTGGSSFLLLRFAEGTSQLQLIEGFAIPAGKAGFNFAVNVSTLTSGQYRIVRTGNTMQALFRAARSDAFTLLGSDTDTSYRGPTTVALLAVQGFNPGGTLSTTPLDVEFDNLVIEAESFVPPPVVNFEDDFSRSVIDSTKWNTDVATSGKRWCSNTVEFHLSNPGNWQDVGVEPCNGFTESGRRAGASRGRQVGLVRARVAATRPPGLGGRRGGARGCVPVGTASAAPSRSTRRPSGGRRERRGDALSRNLVIARAMREDRRYVTHTLARGGRVHADQAGARGAPLRALRALHVRQRP